MSNPVFLDPEVAISIERSAQSQAPLSDRQWIRLVFPGNSNSSVRFMKPIGDLLADALQRILGSDLPPFDAVEVLTFPGHHQQEYLLFGYPTARITGDAVVGSFATDDEELAQAQDAGVDRTVGTFGTLLAETLIDRIGVEAVDINTTPLGRAPTATSRLLSTTTDPISLETAPPTSPFATHIQSLGDHSRPHLARTVLGATDAETYYVDQQVAYFDRASQLLYADGVTAQYCSPQSPRLATAYETPALTTNIEHIAAMGWDRRTPATSAHPTHSVKPTISDDEGGPSRSSTQPSSAAVQTVVGSHHEFAHLLGTGPAEPLRAAYDELGVYPTIELDAATLAGVLGLTPNYGYGQWFPDDPPQRSQPALTTKHVFREASGTDHDKLDRAGETTPPTPAAAAGDLPTDELVTLSRVARQALAGYGDHVSPPSRHPCGAKVTRETPSGTTDPVIIGTETSLTPGRLLGCLQRQSAPPRATVVVDSLATATECQRVFERPFKECDGAWTTLFTQGGYHWTQGQALTVAPQEWPLSWQLNTDGQFRLRAGETTIAAGPRDSIFETCPEDVLFAVSEDDTCRLGPDPDAQHETLDLSALAKEYQPVPLPIIPHRISYLDAVSILYPTDGVLARLSPDQIGTPHDHAWIDAEVTDFVETYTASNTGTQLGIDTVAERFRSYVHPYTMASLPPAQAVRSALSDSDPLPSLPGHRWSSNFDETLEGVSWPYPVTGDQPSVPTDTSLTAPPNRLGQRLILAHSYP